MKIKNRIVADSAALAFVQCITMATGIFQTMVLSRALSKADYGTYSQGLLVVSFISPFLLLGLSNTINYFFNREEEKKYEYVSLIFQLVILLGVIGGIGIIVFSESIIVYFENVTLKPILLYIAFRPLMQNLIAVYQSLYISTGMSKVVALRNFVISVAQLGIIAASVLLAKNLTLIFILLVAMDFIQVIVFAIFFRKRQFSFSIFKLNLNLILPVLRYALPLALATMVGTLTITMDKLLIGRLSTIEDFALYANMSKELPFSFIVGAMTTIITPIIMRFKAKNKIYDLKNLWSAYLEIGYMVTWTLAGGAIVCAPELLEVLYSPQYASGINIFIIYIFISFFRFSYFGIILSAYGKSHVIMLFSLLTLSVNFILNFLLFNWIGIVGPAFASLIAIGTTAIWQILYSCKLLNTKVSQIISFKRVGLFLMELVILGLCIYIIKNNVELNNGLKTIIFYGLFVISIVAVNYKKIKLLIQKLN